MLVSIKKYNFNNISSTMPPTEQHMKMKNGAKPINQHEPHKLHLWAKHKNVSKQF